MTGADYDDGLSAIAIPVMDGKTVYGCLNLVWKRDLAAPGEMADLHLERLTKVADQTMEILSKGEGAGRSN